MAVDPSHSDSEPDFHFVLRFMDDEEIEHELELDEFQLLLYPSQRRISIELSGTQLDELKKLRTLANRIADSITDQKG